MGLVRRGLNESIPDPDRDELDVWPCLSAALLEPSVAHGLPGLLTTGDIELFRRLSGLLAEPAASACRLLAEGTAQAA